MRLFVAVELPPAAAAAAAAVSQSLRQRVERIARGAHLTWVRPDRLHLTVRFLGEVDAARAPGLVEALGAPLEVEPFPLTLGEPGVFPPRGAPRVLWLGIGEGREQLREVEQEVSSRLERAGVPREDRPFTPHLTLARVRDPRGLRGTALLEGTAAVPGGGIVDAITLFESRLSPQGPTYTALQHTPLRRA